MRVKTGKKWVNDRIAPNADEQQTFPSENTIRYPTGKILRKRLRLPLSFAPENAYRAGGRAESLVRRRVPQQKRPFRLHIRPLVCYNDYMSYLVRTFEYLFRQDKGKRFWFLWLFFLPTGLTMGYFFPTSEYFDIFFSYPTATFDSFGAFWRSSFNASGWAILGLIGSGILFVVGLAYVSALLTRHIRVGRFSLPNFFRAINNNFFPALAVTAFFLVVVFLAHLLFVGLAYAWLRLSSRTVGLIFTIMFFLLILEGTFYLLSSTTLWLPTMSFTGTYVFRAFPVAFYKSRNCQRKLFVPCLLAVAICLGVGLVSHFITQWYVSFILHALVYSFVLTLTVAFSFISYCELESIPREDLRRPYFGR